MNKKLFFSVLLSMFSIVFFAKPISENTAKKVGANFLNSKTSVSANITELSLVFSLKNQTQTPYFYVFNIGNKGFIIVSGDDVVLPILGSYLCIDYNYKKYLSLK
jgi:hypothetical protein